MAERRHNLGYGFLVIHEAVVPAHQQFLCLACLVQLGTSPHTVRKGRHRPSIVRDPCTEHNGYLARRYVLQGIDPFAILLIDPPPQDKRCPHSQN